MATGWPKLEALRGEAVRGWVAALIATAATLTLVPSATAATVGIWLTPAEVQALPMSGEAWQNVKRTADADLSGLELMSHRASLHDTATLAVALVAVRTGDASYRRKAAQEIDRAIGSENDPQPPGAGNWHNPIGRNTTSYVIAADLIDLQGYDRELDDRFRAWIRGLRDNSYFGEPPIRLIHEERSNNHGTMAGAARAAVSRYLGDTQELARTAQVLRGWMGDRQSYSFPLSNYHGGADTYMPDPAQPRPVNPVGSVVQGRNVDGWQPQEHARCGTFEWLPCYTIYPWGGLAGATVATEILYRAGYTDLYERENRALLRAYKAVHALSLANKVWWQEAVSGDDSWQPWLANYIYGTSFPTVSPTRPGRNMGWTDWTHAGRRQSVEPPPAEPPPEEPPPEEPPPEEPPPEEPPPEEPPPVEPPPEEPPPVEPPPVEPPPVEPPPVEPPPVEPPPVEPPPVEPPPVEPPPVENPSPPSLPDSSGPTFPSPGADPAPWLDPVIPRLGDRSAPRVTLDIQRRQSLHGAAGISTWVRCSERCRVRAKMLLDPSTARRLGLSRSRRWVTLGVKRVVIERGERRRVVFRLAGRVRAKLRRVRQARLRLRVYARDRSGNGRLASASIVLRRGTTGV